MQNDSWIQFHTAGDVTVKAGHWIGPRSLMDCELVYFPAGTKSVYEAGGMERTLDEPCALFTRPQEPHFYRFDPELPTRHLFIHFDLTNELLKNRCPLLMSGENTVAKLERMSLVPQIMKQLLYYFHTRPHRWRQLSETLLLSVLEELESRIGLEASGAGSAVPLPSQVFNGMKYIDEHLAEKLEIEQVARQVGWSHEHFTRTFQQHVGHTPKEWIAKRRIERAAQLLLQRTDSVKSIAKELGFADEYYFFRLFRRWTGMTTTEYRRRYGEYRFHELAEPDVLGRFYPLNHTFLLDQDIGS